jgi:tRNA (guanine-N7-)-methyltransferase
LVSHFLKETLLYPARSGSSYDWLETLPFRHRVVEIGFGNGDFLFYRSGLNPDMLHLGIEVSLRCIDKAAKRVGRAGRRNVRFLLGDARFLLREVFPEASLEGIYMHFPCPWPKSRHAARRVTTTDFINVLAGVLKIGGFFELVTDEEWYALAAEEALGAHEALAVTVCEPNPARPMTTKYERKWLDMGKTIFRLQVVKERPNAVPQLLRRNEPMHIVLPGVTLPDEMIQHIASLEGGDAGARWVICQSYRGMDGSGLAQVITCDDGFEQRFYLRLVPRQESCLIKVDDASYPFNTPAVQAALKGVARALEARR